MTKKWQGQNDTSFPVESEKIVEDLMYLMQILDTNKIPLSRPKTPLTNAALFTGTASDLMKQKIFQLCHWDSFQGADGVDEFHILFTGSFERYGIIKQAPCL